MNRINILRNIAGVTVRKIIEAIDIQENTYYKVLKNNSRSAAYYDIINYLEKYIENKNDEKIKEYLFGRVDNYKYFCYYKEYYTKEYKVTMLYNNNIDIDIFLDEQRSIFSLVNELNNLLIKY